MDRGKTGLRGQEGGGFWAGLDGLVVCVSDSCCARKKEGCRLTSAGMAIVSSWSGTSGF